MPLHRAMHRLRAQGGEARDPGVLGEEAEELADLLGVHLTDDEPSRVHAPRLGEESRDVGVAVDAQADAERPLLERRQVWSALDRDEAVVDRDKLEERVEQRRLPGRAVAEDDQRAAIAQELGQRGRPGRRSGYRTSSRPRKVVEITPGGPTSPAYMTDVCEKSVARRVTKCSR